MFEASAAPAVSVEESWATHVLRQLGGDGPSRTEHVLEILSYVLSFGSFAVFVWVAKCAVASPSFRPESGRFSRLVYACVSDRVSDGYASRIKKEPGAAASKPESFGTEAMRLAMCTLGIQARKAARRQTRPAGQAPNMRAAARLVAGELPAVGADAGANHDAPVQHG